MTENLRRESDAKTLGELVATVASLVNQMREVTEQVRHLSDVLDTRYQRKDVAEAEAANFHARANELALQIAEEKRTREADVSDLWKRRADDEADRKSQRRWLVAAVILPTLALLISAASLIAAFFITQ